MNNEACAIVIILGVICYYPWGYIDYMIDVTS